MLRSQQTHSNSKKYLGKVKKKQRPCGHETVHRDTDHESPNLRRGTDKTAMNQPDGFSLKSERHETSEA